MWAYSHKQKNKLTNKNKTKQPDLEVDQGVAAAVEVVVVHGVPAVGHAARLKEGESEMGNSLLSLTTYRL